MNQSSRLIDAGVLVQSPGRGESMTELAARDPEKFKKIYDRSVKALSGFSAQKPPKPRPLSAALQKP